MANTGTFRSAINGFNRQDVMDYLESASQRYEQLKKERNELDRKRTEQQARIKELEAVQDEAAALKEQASQEAAEVLEQLRAKEEECEALRSSLEEIRGERDAALAKPAEDPAIAEGLRSEIAALKAQLADMEAKQADTIRKATEYDSMRERIATLELNAVRRAAEIEETARGEARAVIEQAEQQAQELTAKARQDAEDLLNEARAEQAIFLHQKEENYRSFRESLQGAAQETETCTGLLSDEMQRLSEKLKGIVGTLTETSRQFDITEASETEKCCPEACSSESAPAQEASEEAHRCHE